MNKPLFVITAIATAIITFFLWLPTQEEKDNARFIKTLKEKGIQIYQAAELGDNCFKSDSACFDKDIYPLLDQYNMTQATKYEKGEAITYIYGTMN